MPTASPVRRTVFVVAGLAVGLAVAELGARRLAQHPKIRGLGLMAAPALREDLAHQLDDILRPRDSTVLRIDPELGWRYIPGNEGDTVRVNARGHRGVAVVGDAPPAGKRRVAVWGDSFVFCNGVADDVCWVPKLSAYDSTIEPVNLGVGGYAFDQGVLAFERSVDATRPDIALLGLADDDLAELRVRARRFLSDREHPLFKPRVIERADGNFEVEPSPTSDTTLYQQLRADPDRILTYGPEEPSYDWLKYESAWYARSAAVRVADALWMYLWRQRLSPERVYARDGSLRTDAPAFAALQHLFGRFQAEASRRQLCAAVLVLPGVDIVGRLASGAPSPLAPVIAELQARRLPYLDATDTLVALARRDGLPAVFPRGLHYSAAANDAIASFVAQRGIPALQRTDVCAKSVATVSAP